MPLADEPIGQSQEGMGESPTRTQEVVEAPEREETGVADRLAKLVNGNSTEIAKAQLMAQMTANPQFRALLDAQQRGEQVEIVPKGQRRDVARETVEQEKVDWDSLTNSQMAEKLPQIIGSSLSEQLKKMIDEKFSPFEQKFSALEGVAQRSEQEKVASSIRAAQQKYPDFDVHRADMIELSRGNSGLNVEELYVLNKMRKGLPLTPPRPTSTERPTQTSARPSATTQKQPFVPGKRGMQGLLEAALSKRDFSSTVDDD